MKVIYSKCFADPWVKVAQKLQHEQGVEPVYWIGYKNDDSANLVPKAFGRAIYHPIVDALQGVFPKEISDRFAKSYISIDFLKDNASYELQAIKMLDRMDLDRYSFNFTERQRHFRNYLKYWTACINHLKPDLVVSGNIPHVGFDYILYLLCKFYNIKFVAFCGSAFSGWFLPITEISSTGDTLATEYAKMLNSGSEIEMLKQKLPGDIIERYEKVKLGYASAKPDYMAEQIVDHKKGSSLFQLTKKFILDVHGFRDRYFGKDGFIKNGMPTIFKRRGKAIKNSSMTILDYAFFKLRSNAYKNKLKNHYNSLVAEPDLNAPYVLLNLHYQPEMSTSPAGDIFVDQLLCIEVLAKHLPAGHLIYVKEHPSRFYSHTEGHTSRILEFYGDLLAYPQVRFMPLDMDPFLLIEKSVAVATVTGTSGWEAMALGKPVINFGLSWYEKYAGVLKIVDDETASRIAKFIAAYKFDERDLLAYLNAFRKTSVNAYAHPGYKDKMKQDEAQCVSNLAQSVMQMAAM